MFKDRLLEALKLRTSHDEKKLHPVTKKERRQLTSSEQFLKGYNNLWKEGPFVKYQNPDSWMAPAVDDE